MKSSPKNIWTYLATLLTVVLTLTACANHSQTTKSADSKTKKSKKHASDADPSPDDSDTPADSTADAGNNTKANTKGDHDSKDPSKKHDKKKDEKPQANTQDGTPCVNPIQDSQIPAGWSTLSAEDLVTDKDGHYELSQIDLFVIDTYADGKSSSAHTTTTITSREAGKKSLVQTVNCKNVLPGKTLTLSSVPKDNFSTNDGNSTKKRAVKFYFNSEVMESSANVSRLEEPVPFSSESVDPTNGTRVESQLYRISETEIDVRYHSKGTEKHHPDTTHELSASFRYALRADQK